MSCSHLIQKAQRYLDDYFNPENDFVLYQSYEGNQFDEIADKLSDLDLTFSQYLFQLIKNSGLSETDCYKRAGIDRRLFSKIRKDDLYQPSKKTVFAFIIALKLDLKTAERLLDCAGYSLSRSLKFDTLMEFMISEHIHNIFEVNEILAAFDCPLLTDCQSIF